MAPKTPPSHFDRAASCSGLRAPSADRVGRSAAIGVLGAGFGLRSQEPSLRPKGSEIGVIQLIKSRPGRGYGAGPVAVNVALPPFRPDELFALSLCAGAGGLDLGVRITEPRARTVCYVEREAYAAACLVARMEDAALDRAPVWDDVATFDGRPWRGAS